MSQEKRQRAKWDALVRGETTTMSANVRFEAPKAIYVVVSFGDCMHDPEVSYAFPLDGDPYSYDLEANECFLVYRLDESVPPMTRLLEGDVGDAPKSDADG